MLKARNSHYAEVRYLDDIQDYTQAHLRVGDLVQIVDPRDSQPMEGLAIYLGVGTRGTLRIDDPSLALVLWRGGLSTFDVGYWSLRIISGVAAYKPLPSKL